jgi:DNA-binding CsgD family transcriptional regulator
LNGLGEAIDAQFSRWNLTEAEREVALLLLKGLSLKEIAAIRVTAERTVRAQARSLYNKAGLTGRAALSAFFLEDLLAPMSIHE